MRLVAILREAFSILRIVILLCLCLITVSACHGLKPYQPDVQQGNVINQTTVQQLRVGMSKEQVEQVLGLPVLVDTFDDNHWAYAYTFQHRGGKISMKHLNLYFQNNRLVTIQDGR